ncbi:MAG: deoxyguanosinetriphosphate triphosphohydrolase [Gammaproteobacteria bacterium]
MSLAAYAASAAASRGRVHPDDSPAYRSEYQRDRDRVIHSSAFRRLEYKTQVFVNHEGDMFRTRLTHSIEVSQIGRTIARALSLNEDLTEAVCLAHDLGHTPFGHAGQDALNECMRDYGGFEHNLQSLRVVDVLEEKYAGFPGLNLTFETREGILKHCSRRNAEQLGELGERFLKKQQPGLEAQVANIADEIAYNNHDIDDGLRAGMLGMDQLRGCTLFAEQYDIVDKQWPELPEKRKRFELIRRMISSLVADLVETSGNAIKEAGVNSIEEVRTAGKPLISLSAAMQEKNLEMKRFLHANLYREYRVRRMSHKANQIITVLFNTFMGDAGLLPQDIQNKLENGGREDDNRARIIADYVAGMTDRFAILEYERLTDPRING